MKNLVEQLLLNSGWFEGRNVDITDAKEYLTEQGYIINDKAEKFLGEFMLLKISFKNPRNNEYLNTIEIDPRNTGIFKSVIDAYGRHCNCNMIPVADLPQHGMTICITEQGEFYGGYDDWLLKLGDSFD
ncbi:MAG: SUKH-3 domain-containing protein [Acidobacteriota bacterium]